jgi:hypothetical protein
MTAVVNVEKFQSKTVTIHQPKGCVVISDNRNTDDAWESRLWVNARYGIKNSTATTVSATHKTRAGAEKWAMKTVNGY